jgi:copper chaperone CopZ
MMKIVFASVAMVAAVAGGVAWTTCKAPNPGGCCALRVERSDDDCCSEGSPCCAASDACQATAADAAPAAGVTVIAVEEMDCPTCAKKVVAKLNEVAGVAKAVADTKESKVSVTAKEKATPSPKALWEAVEKAGFKPTRIQGPGGTFTSLPKE